MLAKLWRTFNCHTRMAASVLLDHWPGISLSVRFAFAMSAKTVVLCPPEFPQYESERTPPFLESVGSAQDQISHRAANEDWCIWQIAGSD